VSPANPDFEPIVVASPDLGRLKVIADFVEVLRT